MNALKSPLGHRVTKVLLLLAVSASVLYPALGADFSVCEYALVQCVGDATVMDWLSKAVIGQIYYCLNGYSFCKTFLEPILG